MTPPRSPAPRRRSRQRTGEDPAPPERRSRRGRRSRHSGIPPAESTNRSAPRARHWVEGASAAAPVAGLTLVAVLFWGVVFHLDVWSARAFVLLFYGALLCTAFAHASSWWMRRRGLPAVRPWVVELRGGLAVFVTAFVFWAWLPFVTRPFVGWLMRMASVIRFF